MRIIGIDPGTGRMGFAVLDVVKGHSPTLIDVGIITTPAHTPLKERLVDIDDNLSEIIAETKPQVMAIEKLFFARNITTAISVAEARGIVILRGARAGLPIFEYTPLQIKQTLTGYGRADKKQIQEMVKLHLRMDQLIQPDDAADAVACAITHSLMSRFGEAPESDLQL